MSSRERREMREHVAKVAAMEELVASIERKNAKLRELVRDMWREGAFEPGACYVEAAERLEERTRELGIEI